MATRSSGLAGRQQHMHASPSLADIVAQNNSIVYPGSPARKFPTLLDAFGRTVGAGGAGAHAGAADDDAASCVTDLHGLMNAASRSPSPLGTPLSRGMNATNVAAGQLSPRPHQVNNDKKLGGGGLDTIMTETSSKINVIKYPESGVLREGRQRFAAQVRHAQYCKQCGQQKPGSYKMPNKYFEQTVEQTVDEALWKAAALIGCKDEDELKAAFVHYLTTEKPNEKLDAAVGNALERYKRGG